jgi:hypothetical protein
MGTEQAAVDMAVFWGEMTPCEHLVQIYEHDDVFLDTLHGFISGGLKAGDGAIIIATVAHISGLEERLQADGLDLEAARREDRYIAVPAAAALERFMVNGWPDEEKFRGLVAELLERGRAGGRRVRAFGEMVALLWAQGQKDAVFRLENLWHGICQAEAFSLFCAYPRSGFSPNLESSVREVCAVHSRVVPDRARRS